MAFEVREVPAGRTGAEKKKDGGQTERTYVRTFKAIGEGMADALYGPEYVRRLPGVPRVGSLYVSAAGTFDAEAVCQEVTVRETAEAPWIWTVEAQYSTEETKPAEPDDPTLKPPVIKWGSTQVTKVLTVDRDGKPVLNSARERFDPPLEAEETRLTLTVEINVRSFDPVLIDSFVNTVNADDWAGFAPKTVRCTGITADQEWEKGKSFWKVVMSFQIRTEEVDDPEDPVPGNGDPVGWKCRVLDQGYMYLGDDGERQFIRVIGGSPITSPALLDGEGQKLAPGDDPVFLTYEIYDEMDFAGLIIL